MPGPALKPRPALVLAVGDIGEVLHVTVAYGTSQRTAQLCSGEFLIDPADGVAFALSGLSVPTKFDPRTTRHLPYDEEWFRVPPNAPFGQTPKLGLLHPSLVKRARAAYNAARR
jgi:hypothetical protein